MKILLISANTEQINMPTLPLGMSSVAAATRRAGHEVAFLDLMAEAHVQMVIAEEVNRFRPDVIGISVRNIDDQNMESPGYLLEPVRNVVASCRDLTNTPIVLGGAGYSMYPQSALEYLGADMGIQGEGEMAFPMLLERMQREIDIFDTPGLYLPARGPQAKREYVKDLDKFPVSEDHLWAASSVGEDPLFWAPFQTRRGCPLNCSYCSTATIEGKLIRKRTVPHVVKDLARLAENGFRRFFFVDNTFNFPLSYAKELCRRIAKAGLDIAWRCILYPWKVDEDLVKWMAKAGCREVSLGFESGCEPILSAMNKRFNPGEVRQACKLLGDYGIHRMGFLLLGGPGETKASVEESFAFADSLNLEVMKVTVGIRIYPHTLIERIARVEGVISAEDDLLYPRFYLASGLEEWLPETAKSWLAERPNWVS